MVITLGVRSEKRVEIYFNKTNNEQFRSVLPQKAKTISEAIAEYKKTLLPGASSYGRTILADGRYVGDVWCYCINFDETPNAMISYCIFEPELWNNGIATEAVSLFLRDIREKYRFASIGAFTFASNVSSAKVLVRNGFSMEEEFMEHGILSQYYQLSF